MRFKYAAGSYDVSSNAIREAVARNEERGTYDAGRANVAAQYFFNIYHDRAELITKVKSCPTSMLHGMKQLSWRVRLCRAWTASYSLIEKGAWKQ